jgi:hypothetical protein
LDIACFAPLSANEWKHMQVCAQTLAPPQAGFRPIRLKFLSEND